MPRKRRQKKPEQPPEDPKPVADAAAEVMARLKDQGVDIKPASEALQQLPPAQPELEPLPGASPALKAILESRKAPTERLEAEPSHTERVAASRAQFAPVAEGFKNVASFPVAGVKVHKSVDRAVAAVQFAEDKKPERAEKDLLEDRGFRYDERQRQWTRRNAEQPGANLIDATEVAKMLVAGRAEERGR